MLFFTDSASLRHQVVSVGAKIKRSPLRASQFIAPGLLFVVLLLHIFIRVSIIDSSYSLENLRLTALERDAELRQLRLDYSYLTRPEGLLEQASRRLNMAPIKPQNLRKL